MPTILQPLLRLLDALERRFTDRATQRRLGSIIVTAFVFALLLVEASRRGWLPEPWAGRVPTSHFFAIDVAFALVLLFESIELAFGITRSVANALGKQLEILSLILLRGAFKELGAFPEPIALTAELREPVLHMLADVAGALLIFVALGFYYRMQRHRAITESEDEQAHFVDAKRLIALLLLAAIAGLGLWAGWTLVTGTSGPTFFDTFYTALIFADVLIVLISYRYTTAYAIVLRNSAFAVTTVLIRLALAAPPYANAALGVGAAAFAVALTAAYNSFGSDIQAGAAASLSDVD